jgi:hypothetical protein
MAFQTERLGLRTGKETLRDLDDNPYWISISAFRGTTAGTSPPCTTCRPGTSPAGTSPAAAPRAHRLRLLHRPPGKTVTTIEANTSPGAGIAITPQNRGVWKKTRPITGSLLFGDPPRVPLDGGRDDKQDKAAVRFIAAYLNDDHRLDDPPAPPRRTTASKAPSTGRLVQTWGRIEHLYGPTFKIDGVPGPRSRASKPPSTAG